jgi:hypothetical protein
MCIHETVQLSQDGENVIVCGDCAREFVKVAQDNDETLVVPVARGKAVVLLDGDLTAERAYAVQNVDGVWHTQPIYPCRKCGWSMSCPKVEDEPCHT